MTGLFLVSFLELIGVLQNLTIFGCQEIDVVFVHLELFERVDQLDLLRQQQLVFQFGVDQTEEEEGTEEVLNCFLSVGYVHNWITLCRLYCVHVYVHWPTWACVGWNRRWYRKWCPVEFFSWWPPWSKHLLKWRWWKYCPIWTMLLLLGVDSD